MCILCVVQRVSRRARVMLPWLALALVGLWAVSQLLPPPFRLEMTASRLACAVFLLGYFSWYELLQPQLSLWRARRSARLRERRWSQAVELQKLRKTATRRCRNCLNPYKDQSPGGGRFMCSYCGHISKRPVLDIPGPPGSPGIFGDILGRNAWICSQDWAAEGNGNWKYGFGGSEEHCLTEGTYSDTAVFACKLFSSVLSAMRRLGGQISRISSSGDDESGDSDGQGLSGRGENGGNYQESRSEKARRKAEEKRRARLEKEMLEEEERKQREEVARLMEEQRKLRDENSEPKTEHLSRGSSSERTRDAKMEQEKKRQDRKRDRDRGSSKSNSDVEETEKKSGVEIDKRRDLDKKGDCERRDSYKAGAEGKKVHSTEAATHGAKGVFGRSRYFDRVKGSILSTSRGFRGSNFFGKSSQNATVTATKPNKSVSGSVDLTNNLNRKELTSIAPMLGGQRACADGTVNASPHQPTVITSPPPTNVWKKSWHQLFTGSSTSNASSEGFNVSKRDGENAPPSVHQGSQSYAADSRMPLEPSFPCNRYPYTIDPIANISNVSAIANSLQPIIGVSSQNVTAEENELFEDPCYVPDPIISHRPMSDYPDNFSRNVGTGLAANAFPISRKVFSTTAEGCKPSPIESPLSRLRSSENKEGSPSHIPVSSKALDFSTFSHGGSSSDAPYEPGVWHMWGTPLAQESLNMIGMSANRLLPVGKNKQEQENISLSSVHGYECAPEMKLAHFGIRPSLNTFVSTPGSDGSHNLLNNETDPWLETSVLQPLFSDSEYQFSPLKLPENLSLGSINQQDLSGLESNHGLPMSESWLRCDWAVPETSEHGNAPAPKPPVGGLFPVECDVQGVWTFK